MNSFISHFILPGINPFTYDLVSRLDVPKTRRIAKLSCGQRSQVTLRAHFGPARKNHVLDDYSLGLDVGYWHLFLEFFREYVNRYETPVLPTSHIVQELDSVLDRIIILQKGRIIANESKKDVMRSFSRYDLELPLAVHKNCNRAICNQS